MTTFLSRYAICGVNILTYINDYLTSPQGGYILGVLPEGTKITITLEVVGHPKHKCYTLNSKMERTPKTSPKPGVYVKSLTVVEKRTLDGIVTTQVAGWPNNMFCLDINNKTYNIGITSQNGRYFFIIEEWTPAIEVNELIPIGMVLSSSPLRGTAVINIGSTIFNARLHWAKMPWRKQLGLRLLNQGEVIKFDEKDLLSLGGESTFRYEIKACTLA